MAAEGPKEAEAMRQEMTRMAGAECEASAGWPGMVSGDASMAETAAVVVFAVVGEGSRSGDPSGSCSGCRLA